ncbi:MAG: MogA/MoaB family molybdenum cofactor biosynthesis protein [Deltaproteobacteria bacterium]|nr:MogA/MoaB family molybdenum cofactor biosynthesis protein [Deltaproteobacteria bacterium]
MGGRGFAARAGRPLATRASRAQPRHACEHARMAGLRIVTVTVSDTRTAADDASGRALAEELSAYAVVRHEIVRDEPEHIVSLVRRVMEDDEAEVIVLSGGTGIAPRDQTFEAVESLFDKRLDGFGEAFRRLSWAEIGPRAMLSRATAGTIGTRLVFSLPGSEKAVRLGARELIAPILGHAVDLAHGRTSHGPAHAEKKHA